MQSMMVMSSALLPAGCAPETDAFGTQGEPCLSARPTRPWRRSAGHGQSSMASAIVVGPSWTLRDLGPDQVGLADELGDEARARRVVDA